MRNYTKTLRVYGKYEHLVNPSQAKDELSENICPCGIIDDKNEMDQAIELGLLL